ncbi:MAG: ABC transporter permease [Spirochaetales bacterium]|nr:MAG: ABC transporter permease [Spirochaetales bacterium]
MNKTSREYSRWIRYIVIALILGFFIFPMIWLFETSLKLKIDMFKLPPVWLKFKPTMKNYIYITNMMPIFRWGKNSLLISFGTMILSLLIGVPAGYAFSRVKFRGRFVLLTFILLARTIPPVIIVLPFRLLMNNLGIFGTRLAVILIDTVYNASFTAWLMSGIFENIAKELEEAAIIDGCGVLSAFWKVVVPLSLPGLVTSALFAFIYSWNDFLFAMTLTSPQTATLPLGMLSTFGMMSVGWTNMAAMGMLAILPVLVLSLALQRYYVSGLTFGGVK